MAGTNVKGITAAIEKAVKRADWYKANYQWSNDFHKRHHKQFWSVLERFMKKHDLTNEQLRSLFDKVPEQFKRNPIWSINNEGSVVLIGYSK
jgi:formyltetrahydrofolate hydrolase